jgi:preprotein translocase subunit YajC
VSLIIFIPLIILVMYFLMIRPAQAQKRRQAEMTAGIGLGAEVRTIGGLLGTIVEADDQSVTIETTPGTKLKVVRAAIAGITSTDDVDDAESDETVTEDEASEDAVSEETAATEAVVDADETDASDSKDESTPELAADKS